MAPDRSAGDSNACTTFRFERATARVQSGQDTVRLRERRETPNLRALRQSECMHCEHAPGSVHTVRKNSAVRFGVVRHAINTPPTTSGMSSRSSPITGVSLEPQKSQGSCAPYDPRAATPRVERPSLHDKLLVVERRSLRFVRRASCSGRDDGRESPRVVRKQTCQMHGKPAESRPNRHVRLALRLAVRSDTPVTEFSKDSRGDAAA